MVEWCQWDRIKVSTGQPFVLDLNVSSRKVINEIASKGVEKKEQMNLDENEIQNKRERTKGGKRKVAFSKKV